jgi:hypothetical protein
MNAAPTPPKLEVVPAGESTMFDSLARLVPNELQTAYYRVLAHTLTLSPDDEMLRILEAMGILTLLTRHTPKDIADERERFQKRLALHRQYSDEAQRKMLGYVRELEARIADLPGEIEGGLDPKEIAKMFGESLRQHLLQCGVPDTVKAFQAVSAAMMDAQKELSSALEILTDSHRNVVAQVERANQRVLYSLETRTKIIDALLHEWKADLVRIWIPMVAGASMLIGLFGGMEIQGSRDAAPTATATPSQTIAPPVASQEPQTSGVSGAHPKPQHRTRGKARSEERP